ncbi:CGNR zinc finger domain-containing protein [Streptomyces canus]|uniref:CGNR zinc finger domain-containing protein n=1 Tax=Streptomyces canus TaxID=58343 RepID=UPI003443DDBD
MALGRCATAGCENHFVDQSRNRTRRFCSHAWASGRRSRPIGPGRRKTPSGGKGNAAPKRSGSDLYAS